MNVAVSWDFPVANEPDIDSFRIRFGTQPGVYNGLQGVADKTVRTAEVENLTFGTTYYVVIVFLSGSTESPVSNELEVTPQVPAPTNLRLGAS